MVKGIVVLIMCQECTILLLSMLKRSINRSLSSSLQSESVSEVI